MRVPFRCGPLTVTDACPVGKGFPRCGQMGQLPRAPGRGGLGDEDDDDDDDDDNDVDEDSVSSYSDRWVSGSGTPGSFCLACWGSSDLWSPWFPLKEDLGRPLFLSRPIPDPGIFQLHRFWMLSEAFVGVSPHGKLLCQRPVGPCTPAGGSSCAGGPRRGRRPSSKVGHGPSHYVEGMEVLHCPDEEEDSRPHGA
jgi:hypothetical protein